MKLRKIVAIVGMPGAGKTEAANFFRKQNIAVLRLGDEVEEGLKKLGLEINEKNERWYREKIRQELGMAAMALKVEPRIDSIKEEEEIIVLDGLGSWEEYLYLKDKCDNFFLLCIYAPPHLRYQRLKQRPKRRLLEHEAKERDIALISKLNTGGPIAMADYVIINGFSLNHFHKELEKYLDRLKRK